MTSIPRWWCHLVANIFHETSVHSRDSTAIRKKKGCGTDWESLIFLNLFHRAPFRNSSLVESDGADGDQAHEGDVDDADPQRDGCTVFVEDLHERRLNIETMNEYVKPK